MMTLEQILAAVDQLSPDDLERLKIYVEERERMNRPRTAEEWMAELRSIAQEFRGESSDEEMRDIITAMQMKSPPSDKGML